jgi:DNA-directed RNA polymerase subunit RPC12/RpoP
MSERRPVLHLKTPPRALAPAPVAVKWKCKPCGELLEVSSTLPDEAVVRCPACNARLGRAAQFRSDEPQPQGVRARRIQK